MENRFALAARVRFGLAFNLTVGSTDIFELNNYQSATFFHHTDSDKYMTSPLPQSQDSKNP